MELMYDGAPNNDGTSEIQDMFVYTNIEMMVGFQLGGDMSGEVEEIRGVVSILIVRWNPYCDWRTK
jgi:hypothetical protein